MITAYSWACGLFKLDLPSSLNDLTKRTNLINEINSLLFTPTDPRTAKKLLADLDHDERTSRLNVIADKSKSYLPEDLDDSFRKNILFLYITIECYDKALEIDPKYAYALNNRDLAFKKLKDQSEQRKIKWYASDGKPIYE
jgi:hypothetical protein